MVGKQQLNKCIYSIYIGNIWEIYKYLIIKNDNHFHKQFLFETYISAIMITAIPTKNILSL